MPKDLEHIDVNALVPDTPPEELPELDIRPAKRGGKREKAEGERKLQKLDEKTVASLPAAAILNANEKLMDLFARGKKRGKLDSGEMMEVLDDMDLDSDQME